jgi:hypothetical protein
MSENSGNAAGKGRCTSGKKDKACSSNNLAKKFIAYCYAKVSIVVSENE